MEENMNDEETETKYELFKEMFEESLAIGCLMGLFCMIAPIHIAKGAYHKTREKLSKALHPLPKNAKRIIDSFGVQVHEIEDDKYLSQLQYERNMPKREVLGRLEKEGKIYVSYLGGSDELPFSRCTDGYLSKYYDYVPLTEDERNSERIRKLELSLVKQK